MRCYTEEKVYQCSQCDKAFSSNVNFINHMKYHTGEKPYQSMQPVWQGFSIQKDSYKP